LFNIFNIREKGVELIERKYRFQNRLYFDCFADSIVGDKTRGIGFRSYGKVMGWVLWFFGKSEEIHVDAKKFYINKKSYFKFLYRISEKSAYAQSDIKDTTMMMGDLYRTFNRIGYNKFKIVLIETIFSRVFSQKSDFGTIHLESYRNLIPDDFYRRKLNVMLQNPFMTKRD
jgi:hypothetical protein